MRRWTAAGVVGVLTSAAAGQVELRGSEGPLGATVQAVTADGVVLAPTEAVAGGRARVVSWDQVRAVGGEHAGAAAVYAGVADKAFRARARLERGDFAAAEPLLEELFATYRGRQGPTAALVAEGLLRCRLRRGAQGASTWAWLEWVRTTGVSSGGVGVATAGWVGGTTSLPSVRDMATGLVPALPPIWADADAAYALANAPEWGEFLASPRGGGEGNGGQNADAARDLVVRELAMLYRHAAMVEAGLAPGGTVPEVRSGQTGVQIVSEVVRAVTGEAAERQAARAALLARLAARPEPWLEAWCRVAVGRSLLRESGEAERRSGVLQLLHVPARLGREHGYLAGIALADASVALRELGDARGADVLAGELRRRYPTHPALESGRLEGGWRAGAGGAGGAAGLGGGTGFAEGETEPPEEGEPR